MNKFLAIVVIGLLSIVGYMTAIPRIASAASVPSFRPGSIASINAAASFSAYMPYNASGTNAILICVHTNYTTDPGTITMQYASTSMTAISSKIISPFSALEAVQVFYLINPPSGATNNVYMATTNSVPHSTFCDMDENVDQVNPIRRIQEGYGTAQIISTSTTITTTKDSSLVVTVTGSSDGRQHTGSGGNVTRIGDFFAGTGDGGVGAILDSNTVVSPAGTYVSTVVAEVIEHWTLMVFELNASPSVQTFLYGNYYGAWRASK